MSPFPSPTSPPPPLPLVHIFPISISQHPFSVDEHGHVLDNKSWFLIIKAKVRPLSPNPDVNQEPILERLPKFTSVWCWCLLCVCVLYIRLFVVAESCSVAEPYGRTDGRTGTPDCDVQFCQTRDTGNNRHTFWGLAYERRTLSYIFHLWKAVDT